MTTEPVVFEAEWLPWLSVRVQQPGAQTLLRAVLELSDAPPEEKTEIAAVLEDPAGQQLVEAELQPLLEDLARFLAPWRERIPDVFAAEGDLEETAHSLGAEYVTTGTTLSWEELASLRQWLVDRLLQSGPDGQARAELVQPLSLEEERWEWTPAREAPAFRALFRVRSIRKAQDTPIDLPVVVPDPLTCRALRRLARSTWRDRIAPALQRLVGWEPALPLLVTDSLLQGPLRAVRVEEMDGGLVLMGRQGMVARVEPGVHSGPALDTEAVRALVERASRELRGVRVLRLVPWLVAQVQGRPREDEPLVIEGGSAAVAVALGEAGPNNEAFPEASAAYRALLHLLSRTYLHTSHWSGQLYAMEEHRAYGRGRRSRIVLYPTAAMLSGRIRSVFPQGERELVPLPLNLPPLGVEGNGLAPRGRFWWAMLVELRRQAEAVAAGQGAYLPREDLHSIADRVELDRRHIEPTMTALLDAGALLDLGYDHFDLGSLYPQHRDRLVEAGHREESGRKHGTAAAARRAGLFGGGKPKV
jgi:hypothetical protein